MPPHKVRIPKGLVPGPWMTAAPHPQPPPPRLPRRPPGPPNRRPPSLSSRVLRRYTGLLDAWTEFMRLMQEDPWLWVVKGAVHVVDGTFDTPIDDDIVDISYLAFRSFLGQIRDFIMGGRMSTTPSDDIDLQRFETFVQDLGYTNLTDYIRTLLTDFFDNHTRPRGYQTNSSIRKVVYDLMPLIFFSNLNYVSDRVMPPELWEMRGQPSFANYIIPFLTEWVLHDVFTHDRQPYPPLPSVTGEPLTKRQKFAYRPEELFMDKLRRNKEYRRQLEIERIERRLAGRYGGIFSEQVVIIPVLGNERNVEALKITFNDGTELTVRLRY